MSTFSPPAHTPHTSLPSLASLSVNTGAPTNATTGDDDNQPPPAKKRRPRPPLLPCPGELRYDDGEILNMDSDARIMAGSSSFSRERLDIIPLKPPFPASWEELIRIIGDNSVGIMDGVVKELYRRGGFAAASELDSRAHHAYRRTWSNGHRQQYYLKTLTTAATVSHIVSDGEFFSWRESDKSLEVGIDVYSHGFVWCNTNPNWTWRAKEDGKAVRCRIHLPAGMQVIMDRSPVYAGLNECQFDEGRTSLFPDVVLPPGQFELTSVTRYRREGDVDNWRDKKDTDYIRNVDDVVVLAPERHNMHVTVTDAQYAENMLDTVRKFVDVKLATRALMVLPEA